MTTTTRSRLLREAETLTRTRGYSAFSYADLSQKVGIRKASIHHHFPTKESIGLILVDEYLEEFVRQLKVIEEGEGKAADKLLSYSRLFVDGLCGDKLPLCGALAAEIESLPQTMKKKTEEFFDLHIQWLRRIISAGKAGGEFRSDIDIEEAAFLVLSVLEGASLVVWVLKDIKQLERTFEAVLTSFSTEATPGLGARLFK